MFQSNRKAARCAARSIAVVGLMTSTPAWITAPAAAQQQTASSVVMDEILVTARRREENIQEVPISITAFSAQDLYEKNITTSRQLGELTPTYTENPVYGRDTGGFERLRGLPGVRSYFAEAPSSIGGRGAFYDLDNVQVLVGPQGTLFGINAVGGAILRYPTRPSDDLNGYVTAGYGSYNNILLGGAVNVPFDETFAVRLAVQREYREGFTRIQSTGQKVDDVDYYSYRIGALMKPFEGLENYLVADIRRSDTNGPSRFLLATNPKGFASLIFGPSVANAILAQEALGKKVQLGTSYPAGQPHFEKTKHFQLVNTTTYEISPELTLKNIFGYGVANGSTDNPEKYDWDGTAIPIIEPFADNMQWPAAVASYSEELQLQGNFMEGRIQAVVGVFASYEGRPDARRNCFGLRIFGGLPNCTLTDDIGRAQAIFGQATVNLGVFTPALEDLNFTAGYRYNWDYQKQKRQGTNRTTGACTQPSANAQCFIILSNEWRAPGWTFGLDYTFNPGQMAYITASKAYSRGSFNTPDLPASLRTVEPQFNTMLEGGLKTDFDLGATRLRANVAGFFNWFDNVQENVTGRYTDNTGAVRIVGVLLNAAKAHISGFEVTFQWILSEQFEVGGSYSYSKAKYVKYDSFDPITGLPVSLTNRRYPFHADHSGNVTLTYNIPVDASWGEMSVAATATLMSDEVPLDDGAPVREFNRSKLDMRADWTNIHGTPVDFSIVGSNITNHRYPLIGFNLYQTLGILTTNYAEPRTVMATVRYRF